MLVTSPLKMNNTIIEEVEHIKFLAVYIDQHLAWKMHIYYICTKISKTIGMLYKTRFHALNKSLLSLHYSPASCHSLSFYHFSISSHSDLSFPSVLVSFEVVPAPIYAVLFPAFSCSFGPLLWLLLASTQDDCCSWTLKIQHSKILCSVKTI